MPSRHSAKYCELLWRKACPRTALAMVVAAGVALTQVGAAAGAEWASVSGLSWRSGAVCARSGWEAYRNRRDDVYNEYAGRSSWSAAVTNVRNYLVSNYRNKPGRLSIGMPMLTDDTRAQWQACISGRFDSYLRQIAQALRDGNLGSSVLRLGWEANGSGFPWNIKGQVEPYKACFRHEVQVLKSVAPGLLIDWDMKKTTDSDVGGGVQDIYPGDGYVDIIGVNYYDNYPRTTTESAWNSLYNSTYRNGPKGLGTWIAFARSHGKKLSVPEWAIWNDSSGGDNPFFIQKMFETFRNNASTIAYETYFNCQDRHRLYTADRSPNASTRYRLLWSNGH
jgi:hypothetical protein